MSQTIHVWYIYLQLADFYGKCRQMYHTWIRWVFSRIIHKTLWFVFVIDIHQIKLFTENMMQ